MQEAWVNTWEWQDGNGVTWTVTDKQDGDTWTSTEEGSNGDVRINSSAWDGRDQLGQIVSPGTYIMHMEAMNPVTGETQTDAAPIVVGVKN